MTPEEGFARLRADLGNREPIFWHEPLMERDSLAWEAGQPHRQKPDIDNLIKALLDALHKNDSHVASLTVEKRWARRGCIEVEALAR